MYTFWYMYTRYRYTVTVRQDIPVDVNSHVVLG